MSLLNGLYEIVAQVIVWIHTGLSYIFPANSGAAWALSIVLLTVCVRILVFPLFVKQIHASRKMQDLSPQMQALRKKFKNDKQRQAQEMQKLYQESGVNPLSGCLPLIVQLPIFIALFQVLNGIATAKPDEAKYGMSAELIDSAQEAHIFGASIPSTFINAFQSGEVSAMIITGCAVLISSTTTFFTMKSSIGRALQQAPDNPMASMQKNMIYLAPLFGLFGLNFPLGVLLYWVTTNTWTLAQQHYIYKRYPQPTLNGEQQQGSGAAKAAPKAPPKAGAAGGSSGGKNAKPVEARQGRLLGKLKKAPEPEPEPEPQPKVIRQQPVRQPRSRRSGTRKR